MDRTLVYLITSDDNDDMSATINAKRAYEILKNNVDCKVTLLDDYGKGGTAYFSDFVKFLNQEKLHPYVQLTIIQDFEPIYIEFKKEREKYIKA